MANKVKPRICRTNEISIPIDTEECVLWLNPVQSIDDIKNPTRDYAWITPDNTVYVFNGHKIVPIFSTNDSHIKWGHVDGDIKDQKDLYEILLKTVNGVKQNGTELPKDLEQKVNVSVPIMHIKVNDTEVEPNNYTVNIDLTTYAKTSDIPTKLSQLSNDTGYVTTETIDVPIQTITVNGNLLTPDTHKNVSIEIPTKTSQLTNDSGYAKTSDIPTKLSQLSNDTGYVPTETIDVPIQTITVNGNLLTPDTHKNVSIEIPTKTSQLTNDSGYAKTSDIPTKLSQLTNDSGYAKTSEIPTKTSQLTNDSGYAKTSEIPTKTSQLTNDSGYLTKTVRIFKGTTEDGYKNTDWVDGDLYVQYEEQ